MDTVQDVATVEPLSSGEDTDLRITAVRQMGDVLERARKFASGKHDHRVLLEDLRFEATSPTTVALTLPSPFGHASLHLEGQAVTHVLSGQVNPNTGVSNSTQYIKSLMRDGLADLAAVNLQALVLDKRLTNRRSLVRGHDSNVRAVAGSAYKPYDNLQVANEIMRALHDMKGLGFAPDNLQVTGGLSRDRMYIRVILRNLRKPSAKPNDQDWAIGTLFTNDEITGGSLVAAPFAQRTSCENSTARDDDLTHRLRHVTRRTPNFMASAIREALGNGLRASLELVDALVGAAEVPMPDMREVTADLCQALSLSENLRDAVFVGTEGQETLGGLLNGLTYAAHKVHGDRPAVLWDLESLAGRLAMGKVSTVAGMQKQTSQALRTAIQINRARLGDQRD